MIGQLTSGLSHLAVPLGPTTSTKVGARIELHFRNLADGTLRVHGSWIKRGKRQKGVSRYLGHIPARELTNLVDHERLDNNGKNKKQTK